MASVKSFKALRPKKEEVALIASPPYDILNRVEAKDLVRNNPLSFLHVIKAEIDLPDNIGPYDDKVYEKSKENLDSLTGGGHLIKESTPSLYLYAQKTIDHIQNGLVCLTSVGEYDKDFIKKHENTRKAKEEDRTRHINTLNAQAGPVFLAFRDNKEVQEIHNIYDMIKKREPLYGFESDDGVHHTLWKVDEAEEINRIQEIIKRTDCLYIADGHHRAKAASLVREMKKRENPAHTGSEEYNYFLSVVFPHTELKILAYNRVVKDLNGLSKEEFLKRVNEKFLVDRVEGRYEPEERHHSGLYINGEWFHLQARKDSFPEGDVVRSIDASILQENLLAPVLAIENPRESDRIDFVGGVKGPGELERLVNSKEFVAAFALYPTSMVELMNVADAGLNMPPKSTWFEPKLKSGLFIHQLSEE
ncbi:DUF1015 domain-containing protein [candidate division WOR-3 bacterium]|nr:DUF1015 domain-containing protein [candidate division WOR-3 bacterium]